MRTLVIALLALLSAPIPLASGREALPASSQEGRQTLRSGTRIIVHPVTVRDKSGKPVEGLTAADFIVVEDGRPQQLAFCEFQRLENAAAPALVDSPASEATIPQVTDTQAMAFTAQPEYRNRRLIVLYFDLASLAGANLTRAATQAALYVQTRMTSADLVSVMSYEGGVVRVRQDFTADPGRLAGAIGAVTIGGDENADGIVDEVSRSAFGQDDAEFRLFNTDRQLSALQTAMTMLRQIPEQKTVMYFSSGVRLNGIDNHAQLRATINEAIRSNATINPIDARGMIATPPMGDATTASPSGIGIFSGAAVQGLTQRWQRSQDTLYSLARDTGGRATTDDNNMAGGIAAAAEAVTSYYILGYYSDKTAADGKFRRVRITLRDGRSAELSYRDGYFGDRVYGDLTRAERERQLEDAMTLENPITDLALAMTINYFRLNEAEYFVPVALRLSGTDLVRGRSGGAVRTVIDFIGEVKDNHGVTYRNVRDKVELSFDQAAAAQLPARPLVYETGFTLLPGDYVIKMLARESTTGRIGTYQAAFSVPNLARDQQRLPTSSVVLSSQQVGARDSVYRAKTRGVTDAVDPMMQDGVRLVPSVMRVFRASQPLHVFLQAYPPKSSGADRIAAFVTLYRDGVQALQAQTVAGGGSGSRVEPVSLKLSMPLASLAPGAYDLQVSVLAPSATKATFWRTPIYVVR